MSTIASNAAADTRDPELALVCRNSTGAIAAARWAADAYNADDVDALANPNTGAAVTSTLQLGAARSRLREAPGEA